MRFRWPLLFLSAITLSTCSASDVQRKYDVEPAPEFLFERRPLQARCIEWKAGVPVGLAQNGGQHRARTILVPGNQPPYVLTHSEELVLTRGDVPTLTITSDPSNSVAVAGSERTDWSLHFCAEGEGSTEVEALSGLQRISLTREAAFVSINSPRLSNRLGEFPKARGKLLVEAPSDAPVVVYSTFSAVDVRDLAGTVRVAAIHARATILDTSGQVDATAFVIDFAGSQGHVTLSADADINLKMRAAHFNGTVSAWAQRPVRMLVPPDFATSFQAIVNRPEDFVCEAGFCSKIKQEKKDSLYLFTYSGDAPAGSEPALHLRSEQSTVVVYSTDHLPRR